MWLNATASVATSPVTVAANTCQSVVEYFGTDINVTAIVIPEENPSTLLDLVTISRVSAQVGGGSDIFTGPFTTTNPAPQEGVNAFHGATLTYTNHAAPAPICDFITFGRLVVEVGGNKIVISGNAGGFKASGEILGHVNIQVGNTKYNVQDITDYFVATSGPLAGPNTRVIQGTSTSGHTIELRLRDNPAPGAGEPGPLEGDAVWLSIDGVTVVPVMTIDQGNIQLHLVCRGPE
jgi:hypothetical protein